MDLRLNFDVEGKVAPGDSIGQLVFCANSLEMNRIQEKLCGLSFRPHIPIRVLIARRLTWRNKRMKVTSAIIRRTASLIWSISRRSTTKSTTAAVLNLILTSPTSSKWGAAHFSTSSTWSCPVCSSTASVKNYNDNYQLEMYKNHF